MGGQCTEGKPLARGKRNANVLAVEALCQDLLLAQERLDNLLCPVCRCRALHFLVVAHCGVRVGCSGMDEGELSDEEGNCTYSYLVQAVNPTPVANLVNLSFTDPEEKSN